MRAGPCAALWLAIQLGLYPAHAADEPSKILAVEFVAQPRQLELPGSTHLAFRVVNATGAAVKLVEFRLEVVDSPTALQVGKACQAKGLPQSLVPPSQAVTVVCEIGSPEHSDSFFGFMHSLTRRWSLLTLSPGDYQFVAIVEGRSGAEGDETRVSATRAVQVRLVPTVWQTVLGAMLGSLLMVAFWGASQGVVRGTPLAPPDEASKTRGADTLRTGLLLWCASTTAASIAIFMTFRMKDASLPFTLTVNDFYGGLVIGLFGVVLTKWLGPKLFGTADQKTG